jgi:hypothetical protein
MGDEEGGANPLPRGVPLLREPACDEAASPSSCAAEASGGLLGGSAWELFREDLLGVPDCELRCLRCPAGEDILGVLNKNSIEVGDSEKEWWEGPSLLKKSRFA